VIGTAPAAEHQLTKRFLTGLQILVDSLASLLGHFKANGLPRLLLAYRSPIGCIAFGRDILDLQCNNIAGPELAIDGQVEHRKIARSSLCLEFAPDGSDMFGPQRRFSSCKFSFVPGLVF
jgi:hypothetical protein